MKAVTVSQASKVAAGAAGGAVVVCVLYFVAAALTSLVTWLIPVIVAAVAVIKIGNTMSFAASDRRNASRYGCPKPSWWTAMRQAWSDKAFS